MNALALVALLIAFLVLLASGREAFDGGGVQAAIVGGQPARPVDYPWFCTLHAPNSPRYCAGVLIAPDLVLTAAHCVHRVGYGRVVRVGGEEVRTVVERVSHSVYVQAAAEQPNDDTVALKFRFDVAILRLDKPSTKTPIRLAKGPPPPSSPVTVIGTGRKQSYDPSAAPPDTDRGLTKATLTYVTGLQARALLGKEPPALVGNPGMLALMKRIVTLPGIITCVSPPGVTACDGDSGGPLVVHTPAGPELLGIVSDGPPGCNFHAKHRSFAWFASVPHLAAWIRTYSKAGSMSATALGAQRCALVGRQHQKCPKQYPWDAGVWDQGSLTPAGFVGKQCAQTQPCADLLNQLFRVGGAQTRPIFLQR